ncbi:MAG: ferrous iron transport protein A [Clostridiales bacterium]|nr:ferrous iron transport protein A [Clostridiales bacterium]
MQKECTLNNLPLNKRVSVKKIICGEAIKNRIFDLGILENTIITPLFKSPFGDPKAYLVKNAVIALRNKDCENIIVTPL